MKSPSNHFFTTHVHNLDLHIRHGTRPAIDLDTFKGITKQPELAKGRCSRALRQIKNDEVELP